MVTNVARPRSFVRLRGRSYMTFVLMPEPPLAEWLAKFNDWIGSSNGFFVGRPVVLDLGAVSLNGAEAAHLISALEARDIRIMGIEGVDSAGLGPGLPPVLKGGREASSVELVTPAREGAETSSTETKPNSLVLDTGVQPGQSVVFPDGDVIVLGSVAAGAEVVAGGSIHVYGALHGRAIAGSSGNPDARIFCHKLEAELLAIDRYYRVADDIDPALRSRPVQAWLDRTVLVVAEFE